MSQTFPVQIISVDNVVAIGLEGRLIQIKGYSYKTCVIIELLDIKLICTGITCLFRKFRKGQGFT